MTRIPGTPDIPGGGTRQQRAAQIRAEEEARRRQQQTGAGPPGEDSDQSARSTSPDDTQAPAEQQTRTEQTGDEAQPQGPRPVGQGDYVVKQGDCVASIANETGHFWEKVWNDPGNAELKEVRQDPNVLLPDDRVTIPEITPKQEPGETEMRHRFVRRGEPAMIRIRLLEEALPDEGPAGDETEDDESPAWPDEEDIDEDVPEEPEPAQQQQQQEEPLANQPYELILDDGQRYTGHTDADGALSIPIPPNATRARLLVGEGPVRKRYEFELGHVDPVAEVTGVQQRLNNLGLDAGAVDGQHGPLTRGALERFQQRHGLEETGQPDEQTQQRLVQEHGS